MFVNGPPISSVLAAPLWTLEEYIGVREKLASPIPNPKITYSDTQFVTIDTLTRSESQESQGTTKTDRYVSSFIACWEYI